MSAALAVLLSLALAAPVEAMVTAADASARARLETDVAFAYGFGARHAFGATASGAMSWRVCDAPALACRVRAGVLAGYQNEPFGLLAPFFLPSVVTGQGHRAELFATLGFAAHFFSARRLLFEVDFFIGWTGLWLEGSVRNAELDLDRTTRATGHELTFGLNFTLGVRLTEHVALIGRVVLPIPYAGVAKSSYFMATLGPRVTF